jgi:hypothetical protein
MASILMAYPDVPMPSSAAIAFSAGPVNGTGDVQGWVAQAEEDMTITHVGFIASGRTGSPGNTATGARVGIVYINDVTGFPAATPVWADATFSGAAGTAYADYNATSGITLNVFTDVPLTTAVTLQKGTIFGIMFDPLAGTWDTSNLLNVVRGVNNAYPYRRFPYGFETTGTGYLMVNTASPIFYYRNSTRKFGLPYQSFSGVNNNNGSTPDEYGMYFRVPANVCNTYKVKGLRLGFVPGSQNFDVLLYDTNGTTVLHQRAVDGNIMHTTNGAAFDFLFTDDVLATLTAGSFYRLVVRPSTGTGMGSIQYISFASVTDKLTILGNELDVQYTARTNAGAWTEVSDRIWTMQALITDMTQSTGGSTAANPLAGYIL